MGRNRRLRGFFKTEKWLCCDVGPALYAKNMVPLLREAKF